jgi:hypothetical protein
MTHGTTDLLPKELREYGEAEVRAGRLKVDAVGRTRDEVAKFFDGLQIVEPGVVPIVQWRPEVPEEDRPPLADAALYGVVARKP